LKIEKNLSLSKPATTTKNKIKKLNFFSRERSPASARTLCRVYADAVFTASADGKNPSAGKTASAG
jgi:hypothetical protein